MKIKLNRRLLQIGAGCLILAIVITMYTFNQMKKASQPEPTESIAYFADNLTRGIIIKDSDIKMKETPISMIPIDAIRNKKELIDRELIVDVSKNEFALINKTTVRGEVREDVEAMWEIGIEVKEISDFLGSQIKIDEYYALLFADPITNKKYPINKVKITGLVDTTGNTIHPNSEGLPKVVIMAVETEEEMLEIASYKMKGLFELARPPKDWEYNSLNEIMLGNDKDYKEEL
ncbi:hypothetical protein KQI88_10755 [Alkaliphilus sp. MSJ-5]|uniref:SAF domain-containing protein n=1 Tax=Alkaliphilus flagellatus TaxID=2841507 RepID=A0ABS6G331_9FIRM|nr:SAF domain-containing protein [Alkaliphilus flagellatus]MBU5676896.1 hypothetical protein [Alkaliphilus flagellatus]